MEVFHAKTHDHKVFGKPILSEIKLYFNKDTIESIEIHPFTVILALRNCRFESDQHCKRPVTPSPFIHVWHLELVHCKLTTLGPHFSAFFPKLGYLNLGHNRMSFETLQKQLAPIQVAHLVLHPNLPLLTYGFDDYRRCVIYSMFQPPLMLDGIVVTKHELQSTLDYFDKEITGKFGFLKRREIDTRSWQHFGLFCETIQSQAQALKQQKVVSDALSPLDAWKQPADNSPWHVHDRSTIQLLVSVLRSQLLVQVIPDVDIVLSLIYELNEERQPAKPLVLAVTLLLVSIQPGPFHVDQVAQRTFGVDHPLLKALAWPLYLRLTLVGLITAQWEWRLRLCGEMIPITIAESIYQRLALGLLGDQPFRLDRIGFEFLVLCLLLDVHGPELVAGLLPLKPAAKETMVLLKGVLPDDEKQVLQLQLKFQLMNDLQHFMEVISSA